ncbi:MAG TPA: Gfo/Idh/MocA family oxidoreductase [bacterium]|nr:Gfo/Idh/MocA family oxidoreductase [bacterium]
MEKTRRDFLKLAALGAAGATVGMSAKSYSQIVGANQRVNFAIIGLHSRGYAHLDGIRFAENTNISHVCDVDRHELEKFTLVVEQSTGKSTVGVKDFRIILDDKTVDAVTIATPEHWQAPLAIMALKAGKHVYVEKPGSHNPHEGELLVQAQQRYGRLVQLGNQQRSSPHSREIIQKIHDGLIGTPYFGKAWYTNTRKSIGTGKEVPVPEWLDWELWQGPAPRRPYKDNIHPYNWHWFWNWGTGETLNNGTHEVDLCRWALQLGYPERISAAGGRYHYKDDWEFYDTLVANFEYKDKLITWECLSCQGKQPYGRGRGVTIHGSTGTVLLDRDGYELYDLNDKMIAEFKIHSANTTQDLQSRDEMTNSHFRNFIDGIRLGTPLNSAIALCNPSVAMLQTANIAWFVKKTLEIDPQNGHIRTEGKARAMWRRRYEKGWEPTV